MLSFWSSAPTLPSLQCVPFCDTRRFMGLWFVLACKPTYFETSCCNAVERYSLVGGCEQRQQDCGSSKSACAVGTEISIDFQFKNGLCEKEKVQSIPQRGWVASETGERWTVSPFWPIKMPVSN